MRKELTSVFILSDKSSGSSTLQNELHKHPDVHIIKNTKHAQYETLYWIKASILLGLPYQEMIYSSLSYTKKQARDELSDLLKNNLLNYEPPLDDEKLVYDGWEKLCAAFKPVFLEKSPHHLLAASPLTLIAECSKKKQHVDFKLIGLVRNPMDTIYSYWTRWNVDPEEKQYDWLNAYKRLVLLKQVWGSKLMIIKYEDMVQNPEVLKEVCSFISIDYKKEMGSDFHHKSVSKWKTDKTYGFQLVKEVADFASDSFGYSKTELQNNESKKFWNVYRVLKRRSHRYMMMRKKTIKLLRKYKKLFFKH